MFMHSSCTYSGTGTESQACVHQRGGNNRVSVLKPKCGKAVSRLVLRLPHSFLWWGEKQNLLKVKQVTHFPHSWFLGTTGFTGVRGLERWVRSHTPLLPEHALACTSFAMEGGPYQLQPCTWAFVVFWLIFYFFFVVWTPLYRVSENRWFAELSFIL